MKPGSVILASLPQADGQRKIRPALVLGTMPPFDDLLVCGISTQLRHAVSDFDELILEGDDDFESSGLTRGSVIRLGYVSMIFNRDMAGRLGNISQSRFKRLVESLCQRIKL